MENRGGSSNLIIDKVKKINEQETKRVKNEKASDMMIGKWVKCDKFTKMICTKI